LEIGFIRTCSSLDMSASAAADFEDKTPFLIGGIGIDVEGPGGGA
jgi:hypothetical protein